MNSNNQFDMYQFMIESSGDIIFLLDDQDCLVFINSRIESLLGFNKQKLLGRHFSMLVHPEDLAIVTPDFSNQNNQAGYKLTHSVILRLRHKNSSKGYRYFDIKMKHISADTSALCGVMFSGKRGGNRDIRTYGVARDISHLKSFENIININANNDYLTGLPNRTLLKDRIKQAIAHSKREGSQFSIMYFDLDGFKQINDLFGHSAGDIVLQMLSARMKACLREVDTFARVGGDEFVLLLPDIYEMVEIRTIADKLQKEISRPFVISGYSLPVSASIGVALYPENGESLDELISGADRAMYHIKHNTKNGCAFLSELSETKKPSNLISFN